MDFRPTQSEPLVAEKSLQHAAPLVSVGGGAGLSCGPKAQAGEAEQKTRSLPFLAGSCLGKGNQWDLFLVEFLASC